MTKDEVSKRYQIPIKILEEYQSWGLCGAVQVAMEGWQYDDTDLERLSMIMALHDIGFTNEDVETYMRMLVKGEETENARLVMLDKQRSKALEVIHFKEHQLERMDYLRHAIRENRS